MLGRHPLTRQRLWRAITQSVTSHGIKVPVMRHPPHNGFASMPYAGAGDALSPIRVRHAYARGLGADGNEACERSTRIWGGARRSPTRGHLRRSRNALAVPAGTGGGVYRSVHVRSLGSTDRQSFRHQAWLRGMPVAAGELERTSGMPAEVSAVGTICLLAGPTAAGPHN